MSNLSRRISVVVRVKVSLRHRSYTAWILRCEFYEVLETGRQVERWKAKTQARYVHSCQSFVWSTRANHFPTEQALLTLSVACLSELVFEIISVIFCSSPKAWKAMFRVKRLDQCRCLRRLREDGPFICGFSLKLKTLARPSVGRSLEKVVESAQQR